MAQLYYPLDPSLVSEWPGPRDGGSWWHYGTDFAVGVGTPLAASFDGQVVFAGGDGASGQINGVWANGEGLTVDIRRADGLIARYGHLSRIDVQYGQWVTAGQIIGLSGNTGYTNGPHCHWELRWDRAWSGGAWAHPHNLGATALPKHAAPAKPATAATPAVPKPPRRSKKMLMCYYPEAPWTDSNGKKQKGMWAVFGPGFWLEIKTQRAANDIAKQLGFSAFTTDGGGWAKFKRVSQ